MYQVDALQEHNPPPGNHLKADSGAYVKCGMVDTNCMKRQRLELIATCIRSTPIVYVEADAHRH
jgi:hypothetical protein